MGRTNRLAGSYKNLGLPKGRRTHFYCDGGGLYLQVTQGAAALCRSWVFRYAVKGQFVERDGKRWQATRYMGLGPIADVPLTKAREDACKCRELLREGRDPKAERDRRVAANLAAQASTVTFDECAEQYIRAHQESWGNERHRTQWRVTLGTYASPILGRMSVADIQLAHVMRVIGPIWKTKTETASRVRGRIESVLDWATVSGFRSGDNPARWDGWLEKCLPKPSEVRTVQHYSALDYRELPAFMAELRRREGVAALALEFAILTAARSGEVRGATWDEIDLGEKLWVIPAEGMKGGREHRVPLSERAIAILSEIAPSAKGNGTTFVFPGSNIGKPLGGTTLAAVLRRMEKSELTVHGFRSSFRDWVGDETEFPREVSEAALAHVVGDSAEQAYRRSDGLEKRRRLMDAWADYCEGKQPGKVVKLHR
jgi:integrase